MTYTAFIIGADGNVGKQIAAACAAEGWAVVDANALPLQLDGVPDAIVIDCGKPGHNGWAPNTWGNFFLSIQRAASLIDQCNHASNVRGMLLCSTPWVGVGSNCAYAETKRLLEQIAHSNNRFGTYPIVVDRIGMQTDDAPGTRSRFEESVRQSPGELGERIVASLLYAIANHKGES